MNVQDLYAIVVTPPATLPACRDFYVRHFDFAVAFESTWDAAAACARASTTGLEIELSLRDEPFGRRRFGFHDPAGVWVDVVEQIAPQAGYWARYMVPERSATA